MIRIALTVAVISLGVMAQAQQGQPGAHFVEMWDLDGDGAVTLAEATERRGDIFTTFDENEDDILSAGEHDLFDEARAADMQANGLGRGQGRNSPANGMLREVTDADGDGAVSRDEFMSAVPGWFAGLDRDSDGVVTPADFVPRGN
ncbi:EF-hand domain-containing protein [Marimonas arenosa]|uniref:EF-hand domain-containing protein n=1 Tax=Marimonas arenosa TaxID=1795305 RepID=A0AAE4B734_9RHOB|nr:EF-hand domain-containing protein [Marimonas arenosa]MDQ2091969.1 EF-hand domain-containing protein [Marimonas arenosa]